MRDSLGLGQFARCCIQIVSPYLYNVFKHQKYYMCNFTICVFKSVTLAVFSRLLD